MPRRSGDIGTPAGAFVGGRFPGGRLRKGAPAGAAEMAAVARALRVYLDETGLPIRTLAERAGLDRTTIHAVLAGRVYVDVVTLARLERTTGRRLWPYSEGTEGHAHESRQPDGRS